VGGRKTWGKRWPVKNFCQLIAALYCRGVNVVTFFGPEEKDWIGFFRDALDPGIPLVFEPSCRAFAAMVSNCDLFVTCDSGPMHLSCGLGVRTVAIFQKHNFDHWGPPPALARIVYQAGGPPVEEVLKGCLAELAHRLAHLPEFCGEGLLNASPLTALPKVAKVTRTLEMSVFTQKLLLLSRYGQALSLLTLIIYTWFFPHSGLFAEGTWLEAFTDTVGIASVVAGGCLRIWAASYLGAWSGQQRLNIPALITRGPYAYIRHPLYIANCIIGFGIIFLLDAFPVIPFFIALAFLQHITVIPAEEALLKEKLGGEFELYRYLVPRYIPTVMPRLQDFSFGMFFSLREVGAVWGVLLVACFFDWMQEPVNRNWFLTSYAWFANKIFL
jgi:protein-S-isoprenylcysteine O-methyltransferase Ste14